MESKSEAMDENEFMLLLYEVINAARNIWPNKDDCELVSEIEERLQIVMDEMEMDRMIDE